MVELVGTNDSISVVDMSVLIFIGVHITFPLIVKL